MRIGADFRIKCMGCGRVVMLPRTKLEKSVKKIVSSRYGQTYSAGKSDSHEHREGEPDDLA